MKRVDLTYHTLAWVYAHITVPDEVFDQGYEAIYDWLADHYYEVIIDERLVDPIQLLNDIACMSDEMGRDIK